jgi:dolichyl-phosphate beta-glucosyltransferase
VSADNNKVWLVIPCFRESGRIGPFLQDLQKELAGDANVRVQVVDDGSGPEEAERLREIIDAARTQWPALRPLLQLPANQGKGGAVYAGWAANEGEDWLAFVDADGACSAQEVKRLLSTRGNGALFASRVMILGRSIRRHFYRHLLGRVFATIVSELLHIPVYDSQCGLKLVPRAAWEKVRPKLRLHGFSFDVELLCALLDAGCPVIEVPIDWHEVPGGKVRILSDSWRMFRDVLSIRQRRHNRLDTTRSGS